MSFSKPKMEEDMANIWEDLQMALEEEVCILFHVSHCICMGQHSATSTSIIIIKNVSTAVQLLLNHRV